MYSGRETRADHIMEVFRAHDELVIFSDSIHIPSRFLHRNALPYVIHAGQIAVSDSSVDMQLDAGRNLRRIFATVHPYQRALEQCKVAEVRAKASAAAVKTASGLLNRISSKSYQPSYIAHIFTRLSASHCHQSIFEGSCSQQHNRSDVAVLGYARSSWCYC